jgi:hypothetical protein
MVDLALLQSVSYIAGALGVCVAAAYYVLNLRNTIDNRKAQHLMEFNRIMNSKEWLIDLHESMNYEWKDWDDFWQKYGHPNPEAHSRWIFILNSFGNPFTLLKWRLVDEEMLREYLGPVSFMPFWEKFSPCIREMRVLLKDPNMCRDMEFYYNKWSTPKK